MTKYQEIWPNFFIVGAPKAGTTSMYHYLEEIPGIYMSPVKEPNYFAPHLSRQHDRDDVVRSRNDYLALFKGSDGYTAIGEASPTYLRDPDAPELIYQVVPGAKIIMIIRDPAERAYSHYLMNLRYSNKQESFYDELIKGLNSRNGISMSNVFIESGMYHEQVKRYFDQFGRERVKVLIFEEFTKDPVATVNEVLAFLGVNHRISKINDERYNPYSLPRSRVSIWVYAFFSWLSFKNLKPYKFINLFPDTITEKLADRVLFQNVKKPPMPPEARQFLQKIYYDDVTKLESLLERTLPWSILKQK